MSLIDITAPWPPMDKLIMGSETTFVTHVALPWLLYLSNPWEISDEYEIYAPLQHVPDCYLSFPRPRSPSFCCLHLHSPAPSRPSKISMR